MKGTDKIIPIIDKSLLDERIAVNQNLNHLEMSNYWYYKKFHPENRKQPIDEKYYSKRFAGRLLFFEETQTHSILNSLESIHPIDDRGIGDLLSKIWNMDGGHIDWKEI